MKSENNNVGTLPIDVIVTLMKLLVVDSFKDFFNFFIAWAQTQRRSVIIVLLDNFPLRDLYKFRQIGGPSDATYFDRFFRIGEELRINDAIFYGRCREIVCGFGNIERHFTVVDEMAMTGQFLYMVGKFVLRNVYKKQRSSVSTVDDLKCLRSHPHYRMSITRALKVLQSIYWTMVVCNSAPKVDIQATCGLHTLDSKALLLNGSNGCGMIEDCLFCDIATLLNVFTNTCT
ncbi:hypothetical protein POM88_021415 [Heracleum sosnowskyi]|uniref:Uncharacterized protein n=1 Tax=Heracleum sosnowskyi TaxID=360622 RepID=A0AAD8IGV3_9APIA|nr:hypothetical protein POM88_021415 [Heracleum sosnowskyi]